MKEITLPRITIVTPTLNQGQFIEQTILSVLSQEYPDLEYIIMDGGSTDNTLEILKKYGNKLHWYSEIDQGQSNAINKGMKLSTGEICAFLNSDDTLAEGALLAVGNFFLGQRDAYWLTGKCKNIDDAGVEIRSLVSAYKNFWLWLDNLWFLSILNYISQPATFWRKAAFEKTGYFNESLHYTMDYEYWLRLRQNFRLHYLNRVLANFRVHPGSKSGQFYKKQFEQELEVSRKFSGSFAFFLHKLHKNLIIFSYDIMSLRAAE